MGTKTKVGQWTYHKRGSDLAINKFVVCKGNRTIAWLINENEAALIAAAPELLEVVKLAYLELSVIPAFGDSIGDKITKAQIGVLIKRLGFALALVEKQK